jgi:hypothetical protein
MSTPAAPIVPLADRTTWAKRNPCAKVQPLTEPKRKLTPAEKATRKIASAQKKQSQAALNAAIAEYLQQRAEVRRNCGRAQREGLQSRIHG